MCDYNCMENIYPCNHNKSNFGLFVSVKTVAPVYCYHLKYIQALKARINSLYMACDVSVKIKLKKGK